MNNKVRQRFFAQKIPRYRQEPVQFAREVLRFEPDEWQKNVLNDLAHCPKVTVRSGQGVGKTGVEACALLWFLSCFPFARVVATAPTRQQLNDVLWSEVAKWQSKSPLLNEILSWTKTYISVKGYEKRWFATARTATKAENMQGFHEDNMLFIVDEASGVADAIMEAVLGTLSGVNNKLLMCGNPTQKSGVFYDSHTKDRNHYQVHKVSSLDSPRTNKDNIDDLIKKYGAQSNVVRVRVLGEFPQQEDDIFMPIDLVERAVMGETATETPEYCQIGVDVARFGDDDTVIAVNSGAVIAPLFSRNGIDTTATCGNILRIAQQERDHYQRPPKIVVVIDDTGIGGGVTDQLRAKQRELALGWLYIIPLNMAKSVKHAYYADLTAYLWGTLRERLNDGDLTLPNDNELIAQLTSRKYAINSSGKIKLESKDEMKARGIKSPDMADAVTLSCYPINIERLFALGGRRKKSCPNADEPIRQAATHC